MSILKASAHFPLHTQIWWEAVALKSRQHKTKASYDQVSWLSTLALLLKLFLFL